MLCRNGDAVPEGHKGQTANLAWWRELHCDRKSSLFAAQLGDGNLLRHDRVKNPGSPSVVSRNFVPHFQNHKRCFINDFEALTYPTYLRDGTLVLHSYLSALAVFSLVGVTPNRV
jgi:hypothetical protein